MGRYASETSVPVERSRAEIERTLARYGADRFMYAASPEKAMIAFQVKGRHIRMLLPMPTDKDKKIALDRWGYRRSDSAIDARIQQEARSRWRALGLVIKAKLEAVESGIAVFEDEFLAYMVLPDGGTVGEWARPQIAAAYESGKMPALLPSGMD